MAATNILQSRIYFLRFFFLLDVLFTFCVGNDILFLLANAFLVFYLVLLVLVFVVVVVVFLVGTYNILSFIFLAVIVIFPVFCFLLHSETVVLASLKKKKKSCFSSLIFFKLLL